MPFAFLAPRKIKGDKLVVKWFIAALLLLNVNIAFAQICAVNTKNLAADQIDEARTQCLQKNVAKMKVQDCLSVATQMHYQTYREQARQICQGQFHDQSLQVCQKISQSFEDTMSKDQALWGCIKTHWYAISDKTCLKLGRKMHLSHNKERAEQICLNR